AGTRPAARTRPRYGPPGGVHPASAACTGPGAGTGLGSGLGVGLDVGGDRGLARLDGRADDVVQPVLGLPAQGLGDAVAGADQAGRVAGAAGAVLRGDLDALGAGDRVDHLEHARALAGADVEGAVRAFLAAQVVQRGDVGVGEVQHVHVVADAGAVGGVVVVAEHHGGQSPLEAVQHDRHQVHHGGVGELGPAGPGDVEVPQRDGAHA